MSIGVSWFYWIVIERIWILRNEQHTYIHEVADKPLLTAGEMPYYLIYGEELKQLTYDRKLHRLTNSEIYYLTSGENLNLTSGENLNLTYGENLNLTSGENLNLTTRGEP